MKKTIGYFFKEPSQSMKETLRSTFYGSCLSQTEEEARDDIDEHKAYGNIPKNARPKVFRVTVEEV